MPSQPTPQPTIAPYQVETVNLLDLHDYLKAHKLRIVSGYVIGEKDGKLWIEVTTQSVTATASDGVTSTPSGDGSQPRHDSPQSQKDGGESRRGGTS